MPEPWEAPCECGKCARCWYQRVKSNPGNMATFELRDAYQAATGEQRRAVLDVIRARGYRVECPPPPHSGPVVLRRIA